MPDSPQDDPFIGADLIHSYSTDQAIDDGFLIHVDPIKWPWLLITSGVEAACRAASEFDGRTYEQRLIPLLNDCIMETQRVMHEARQRGDPGASFVKLEHTVAGTVHIRPNDKGGMTVMLPEEY